MTAVHHPYATIEGQELFNRESGPVLESQVDVATEHIRRLLERTLT
jgi:hypothetical protein